MTRHRTLDSRASGAKSIILALTLAHTWLAVSLFTPLVTMSFVNVDLLALATDANYFSTLPATDVTQPAISLLSYHGNFETVVGHGATARLIADLPWQAFHEAGVYNRHDHSLYLTSNYVDATNNINITVVSLRDYSVHSTHFPDLWQPNGGSTWHPPGHDRLHHIYCDQGDLQHPSALVSVDPAANTSTVLLTNFHGRNFSSINDVRQHPLTGHLWFTDAAYGWFQGFRPEPTMPHHVYRFEPATGALSVVADGFDQPNGLEFSPDLRTLYVSDSGSGRFTTTEPRRPSTVYAFDVVARERLANRRLFAYTDVGFPDCVRCDTSGNVWVAAGDGVHVWDPSGVLLGKIFVGEEVNSFAFVPGRVFVFSNKRLWVVENVSALGREACKDFGLRCAAAAA